MASCAAAASPAPFLKEARLTAFRSSPVRRLVLGVGKGPLASRTVAVPRFAGACGLASFILPAAAADNDTARVAFRTLSSVNATHSNHFFTIRSYSSVRRRAR